jgi:hypothetical protein
MINLLLALPQFLEDVLIANLYLYATCKNLYSLQPKPVLYISPL